MSGNGDEEGARWLLGVRDTVVDTWQEYDPDLYDDLATDSIYDRPPSSLGVWTVWRDLQLWQHDEAMAEAFPHMGDDPTELARRALNFVGRYLVRQVLASLQEEYR